MKPYYLAAKDSCGKYRHYSTGTIGGAWFSSRPTLRKTFNDGCDCALFALPSPGALLQAMLDINRGRRCRSYEFWVAEVSDGPLIWVRATEVDDKITESNYRAEFAAKERPIFLWEGSQWGIEFQMPQCGFHSLCIIMFGVESLFRLRRKIDAVCYQPIGDSGWHPIAELGVEPEPTGFFLGRTDRAYSRPYRATQKRSSMSGYYWDFNLTEAPAMLFSSREKVIAAAKRDHCVDESRQPIRYYIQPATTSGIPDPDKWEPLEIEEESPASSIQPQHPDPRGVALNRSEEPGHSHEQEYAAFRICANGTSYEKPFAAGTKANIDKYIFDEGPSEFELPLDLLIRPLGPAKKYRINPPKGEFVEDDHE